MISDWRTLWGQGDFPFGIVQLANFMAIDSVPVQSDWAELRESQAMVAFADSNNGLASAIDIGDAGNIHPTNKQEVGRRLSLWALARAYGKKGLEYSGPRFDSMSIDSGKVTLRFTHADSGLVVHGKTAKGFAIAGPDSHFVWATAEIRGNRAKVWSDSVTEPTAVRYGWANNPVCNLYNRAGLPMTPFRTDSWVDPTPQ
jgi:sialate O-acetylesterase